MLYLEDFGYPLPEWLEKSNFTIPHVCVYENKNLQIRVVGNQLVLFLDGVRNMGYTFDHSKVRTFYSHYELAYGHVILTGLGMGVAATWLANKKEVTKITVIENNIHLINYFKEYGNLPNKVEVVYDDAERYEGKCDVLFCNHWIKTSSHEDKYVHWKSMLDNIQCDLFYIWRIPRIVNKDYEQYLKLKEEVPKLPDLTKEKFELYSV